MPLPARYVPAGQGVQRVKPASLNDPAWQRVHDVAPTAEKVPVGQKMQVADVLFRNVPAMQRHSCDKVSNTSVDAQGRKEILMLYCRPGGSKIGTVGDCSVAVTMTLDPMFP